MKPMPNLKYIFQTNSRHDWSITTIITTIAIITTNITMTIIASTTTTTTDTTTIASTTTTTITTTATTTTSTPTPTATATTAPTKWRQIKKMLALRMAIPPLKAIFMNLPYRRNFDHRKSVYMSKKSAAL